MNKTLLKELNIDTLDISRMAIQKFQNLEKAALLSLYLEKHKNFSEYPELDGWFYFTHKEQQLNSCLSEQKIIKYKKEFIKLGILSQKTIGMPSKQWFKINEVCLIEFLTTLKIKKL